MSKTVLITGGSRGIGKATAQVFAQKGYQVAICCRQNTAQAQELAHQIGGFFVQADIGDEAQVQAMTDAVLERFGTLDVLVNNAGIALQGLLTQHTTSQWQRLFDVNVNGTFYTTRNVLPHMIRRKQGSIVNLSSVWGITGASCEVGYSATKAAIIGFTKALAQEVAPSGIRVNCVAPGVIDTDMNGGLDEEALRQLQGEIPLGTMGTPQDVAHSIFFLASEDARYITGQVLSPNGGFCI